MPPIVNDRVTWSVGLSVGLSPSKSCRKFRIDWVQDLVGPRERPITYSKPLWANTILCSFNTILPSSCSLVHCWLQSTLSHNLTANLCPPWRVQCPLKWRGTGEKWGAPEFVPTQFQIASGAYAV